MHGVVATTGAAARSGAVVDARARLVDAAIAALVEDGFGGASARVVAGRAGVAPGLIYHHYGDLWTLHAEAARQLSAERAEVWAARLDGCSSLAEVVAAAEKLHDAERQLGSLVVLAQLLAGGRGHAVITEALRENFALLAGVVRDALARVLDGTALGEVLDPHRLARTISAGFVGLELWDGVLDDTPDLFDELRLLAALADDVVEAGTLTQAVVRHRLRRAVAKDVTTG